MTEEQRRQAERPGRRSLSEWLLQSTSPVLSIVAPGIPMILFQPTIAMYQDIRSLLP